MINPVKLLETFQAIARTDHGHQNGPVKVYEGKIREQFGVTTDSRGRKVIKDPQINPGDFSIAEVFEAFMGKSFARDVGFRGPQVISEAIAGSMGPSNFQLINAFNATVFGLLERVVLEAFQAPAFIGDSLVTTDRNIRINGGKGIGIAQIPESKVKNLQPAEEYPSAGLEPYRLSYPENVKKGLAIPIEHEAILYDASGDQILARAGQVGDVIARRKDKDIGRTILGINNNYKFDVNGTPTANNTYQAIAGAKPFNYVNALENPLVKFQNVNNAIQALNEAVDPVNGEEITGTFNTMIVMPQGYMNAQHVLQQTVVISRSPYLPGTDNGWEGRSGSLLPQYDIQQSIIWRNLLVNEAGMSKATADLAWLFGDFKKSFGYREVFPIRVQQANPSSADMLKHGLVNLFVADEMGTPYVREPRLAIFNMGVGTPDYPPVG